MWAICAASVIGRSHVEKSLGCDDAYAYGTRDDFLVAAVADGAGSVTGTSAWGSYTACREVVQQALTPEFIDAFASASDEELNKTVYQLFSATRIAVVDAAREMGLESGKLATTLCVAIAQPGVAVFAQIGDGVIAIESGGEIRTVLPEAKQGYANTTWFLQSKDAFSESFRAYVDRDTTAFALSTDGMTYKVTHVNSGEAYRPFFESSWKNVRNGGDSTRLAAMLHNIPDDQTGDDKTLVVAALPIPGCQESQQRHLRGTATIVSSGWPHSDGLPSESSRTTSTELQATRPPEVLGSGRQVPRDQPGNPPEGPRPQPPPDDRECVADKFVGANTPNTAHHDRRTTRLNRVALLLSVVALVGVAMGWILSTIIGPSGDAETPPSQELGAAKHQTCGGYQVLSGQWASAYHAWISAVPQPIPANDPAAQAETAKFDSLAIGVAQQMMSSITPDTPSDVREAIAGAGAAITSLAISNIQLTPGAHQNDIAAVEAAVDRGRQVCGLV